MRPVSAPGPALAVDPASAAASSADPEQYDASTGQPLMAHGPVLTLTLTLTLTVTLTLILTLTLPLTLSLSLALTRHTDQSFREPPPRASAMFCVATPADGSGATLFAGTIAAHAALPAAERARLRQLRDAHPNPDPNPNPYPKP